MVVADAVAAEIIVDAVDAVAAEGAETSEDAVLIVDAEGSVFADDVMVERIPWIAR